MPQFSIIVPIFNRPDEAKELLESLSLQTSKNFELVLVEDGSSQPCNMIVNEYTHLFPINYIAKVNTGRSDSRNVGMRAAKGEYFVFFDSDCIIPPEYFATLEQYLSTNYSDCFGGPDRGHPSFTQLQKAINYAMTSFWTTGGIRGGKVQMEKFKPRTFNMGYSRKVYEAVGDFKEMIGEDIDLSMRILQAGFTTCLYQDTYVYHKRRVDLRRFYRQMRTFGQARINLYKLYPDSLKLVHLLPALFVLGSVVVLLLAVFVSAYFLLFPLAYILLLFTDSLIKNKQLGIALLSLVACFIQLYGYGFGFIKAVWEKVIMKRDLENIETLKKIGYIGKDGKREGEKEKEK